MGGRSNGGHILVSAVYVVCFHDFKKSVVSNRWNYYHEEFFPMINLLQLE